MLKALYVAGTFDNEGGDPSKIADELILGITRELDRSFNASGFTRIQTEAVNGGYLCLLEDFAKRAADYDIICWFANVKDNELPKAVQNIKRNNPKCVLVTSKRVIEKEYTESDIVAHALNIRSNLVVVFRQDTWPGPKALYYGSVVDPLGNLYKMDRQRANDNFIEVGTILGRRITDLLRSSTRVGSRRIEGSIPETSPDELPDEGYYNILQGCARKFSKLIPVAKNVEPTRFVGNASFRCTFGFPSYKANDLIYVSKRNIDKSEIDADGFVPVRAGKLPVEYYGGHKPSVDTPIHVMLYNYYDIKYILHGHVYVKDTPITDYPVPCGSLEEFNAIIRKLPVLDTEGAVLNLAGHGFIAMANDATFFNQLKSKLEARPLWEEWEV
jgi:hypothetical protein